MKLLFRWISVLGLFPSICCAKEWASYEDCANSLMKDLMIVGFWDCYLAQRYPVTYNHLLYGGYLNMPSARMGCQGEVGFGFAHVPPYNLYNLRVQLTDRLEMSGNYRVFIGMEDPVLSCSGFGDRSDKGANIKIALLRPEDSDYRLPGFAFGVEDFMGTKAFTAEYVVLTKVHLDYNLEWSLGYGGDRIDGWFGGVNWMPFLKSRLRYLQPLSLVGEYDATPYKNKHIELHPDGRNQKTKFNIGAKYRLMDRVDLSVGYVRGEEVAASISTYYNFGYTKGFLPKYDDCLPYRAPINQERVGPTRPESVMVQDFTYAMKEQGFELLEVSSGYDQCANKILRMVVYNEKYRLESEVRARLSNLLAYLTPADVSKVVIVRESEGFPIQEYIFPMTYIRSFSLEWMGNPELDALTPMRNVGCCDDGATKLIYLKRREWANFELLPKTRTVFGSSTGKFKYAVGLNGVIDGFLWGNIYYICNLGLILFTDMNGVSSVDRLNPSQLINVHTQVIDYYKQRGLTFDQLYLQRSWNMGCGVFSRLSVGYFTQMYGGVAGEVLYYPVNEHNWAVGLEGAILKRRTMTGLGFFNTIRKLDGFQKQYVPFTGSQVLASLYYDVIDFNLDFRVKAGKFLANDWGGRFELSRYFPSGMRITVWYTWTNGNDRINGHQYYDKGIAFSMPMDIFYTHSDRARWNYAMSAWLRDVGYSAYVGESLYNTINDQRQWK